MAMLLLTAAETGEAGDCVINPHWILMASMAQLDPASHALTLYIKFAVTIENPPIGGTPLDVLYDAAFRNCPDPAAVLRKIAQAR